MSTRLGGMGATDVVEVAGLAPWKDAGPWRVWNRKTGVVDEKEDETTEEQEWGHEMESFLCDWYARQVGRRVDHYRRGDIRVLRADYPWLWASPDGRDVNMREYLEVKNVGSFMAHHWNRADDDGIPHFVRGQVTIGMFCAQVASWKVVAAIGGLPPRIYHVDYDEELAERLVKIGADFWQRVQDGTHPPVDGSAGCLEYLNKKYPRDTRPVIESSAAMDDIAAERIKAHEMTNLWEGRKDRLDAEIKSFCGDHAGVLGLGWKFSWKIGRDGKRRSRFTVKGQADE